MTGSTDANLDGVDENQETKNQKLTNVNTITDTIDTARLAVASGFHPVLIRKGTKKATHDEWPDLRYTADTLTEFSYPNAAIGLMWGLGHADVDLETPEVSLVADYLLPNTPMVWGRIRNPRSHRVFGTTDDGFKGVKLKGPDGKSLVEVRGLGQQSVVPPSPWYNKEIKDTEGEYRWWDGYNALASDALPTPIVDVRELEVMVRECAFVAVVAKLWPDMAGSRHDAMIGIAGLLLKNGRALDRVMLICRCITEFGKDPDAADRLQIPKTSAARLEAGEEVAGYTLVESTLGEPLAKWVAAMFHLPVDKVTTIAGITLNDAGNAELFAELWGKDLMYLPMRKDWCGWTGKLWDLEPGGYMEQTKAKATVKHMEALSLTLPTSTERLAMRQHAVRSGSLQGIRAMSTLSKDTLKQNGDNLDSDPWLFNVPNGTIDLRTGELRNHSREDYITKMGGCTYDRDAVAPMWLAALEKTFDGNQELIDFLQRMAGYMLTGITREQCLFFYFGGGANGKSTFIETLTAIWGDYALRSPTETVMKKKNDAGIPNDVARLRGARLVVTQEIGANMQFSENVIKDLTGDDTKTARFLHGEWFDFKPELKLVLYGNHKPTVTGTDDGIWRRIKLIPFLHSFKDDDTKVDDLARVLFREEGPGILRWCVEGCLKWQVARLNPPEIVVEATAEYRGEMDVFGDFYRDHFHKTWDAEDKVSMERVFQLYLSWANDVGERPLSQRKVNAKMIDIGAEKYKSNGKWFLRGVAELPNTVPRSLSDL